jgi:ATP-dependent Lon protease
LSCKTELKTIQSKVRFDLDQQQREYFQQQMKTTKRNWVKVSQEEETDDAA